MGLYIDVDILVIHLKLNSQNETVARNVAYTCFANGDTEKDVENKIPVEIILKKLLQITTTDKLELHRPSAAEEIISSKIEHVINAKKIIETNRIGKFAERKISKSKIQTVAPKRYLSKGLDLQVWLPVVIGWTG